MLQPEQDEHRREKNNGTDTNPGLHDWSPFIIGQPRPGYSAAQNKGAIRLRARRIAPTEVRRLSLVWKGKSIGEKR